MLALVLDYPLLDRERFSYRPSYTMARSSPTYAPTDRHGKTLPAGDSTGASRESHAPGRSLAFHGAKGGVGATTLAVEAAFYLSGSDRSVAAVDLDLERGDMDFRLDVPFSDGRLGVPDVLALPGELERGLLEKVFSRAPCGARLLPSTAAGERELAGSAESEAPGPAEVPALVGLLRNACDHVVVDTACNAEALTVSALGACDGVVVVTTPELSSVGLAGRAIKRLTAVGVERGAIRVVVNRAHGGDSFTPADIGSFLSIPVIAALPEAAARCRRLADGGRSICSERSRLSREVFRLMRGLFG